MKVQGANGNTATATTDATAVGSLAANIAAQGTTTPRRMGGNPQWVKGQSGNPIGRPKNVPLIGPELRRQLGQPCPYDSKGRPWLVVIADAMLLEARNGNGAAIKEVCERIDGKVKETIELDIKLQAVKSMTDEQLEEIVKNANNGDGPVFDIKAEFVSDAPGNGNGNGNGSE